VEVVTDPSSQTRTLVPPEGSRFGPANLWVTHSAAVGQVRRWIESGSADPRVAIKKARMAELLAAK
jgi:hypothetical protein